MRDVKGEKERFRVEAGRQLTYADGRTKLMDVKISVDRAGKSFVITGEEAQVGDNQSSVQLKGKVHLTGSDGLKLDAAAGASYSDGEGIVRAPGPVTFSRGTMTGKGVDFTYDRNRDAIGLSDQTAIQIAPDKKDTAGADIKAGAALLARKDRFMSFERDVHIVRGDQIIDAERAVADLTVDEKHITALGRERQREDHQAQRRGRRGEGDGGVEHQADVRRKQRAAPAGRAGRRLDDQDRGRQDGAGQDAGVGFDRDCAGGRRRHGDVADGARQGFAGSAGAERTAVEEHSIQQAGGERQRQGGAHRGRLQRRRRISRVRRHAGRVSGWSGRAIWTPC